MQIQNNTNNNVLRSIFRSCAFRSRADQVQHARAASKIDEKSKNIMLKMHLKIRCENTLINSLKWSQNDPKMEPKTEPKSYKCLGNARQPLRSICLSFCSHKFEACVLRKKLQIPCVIRQIQGFCLFCSSSAVRQNMLKHKQKQPNK